MSRVHYGDIVSIRIGDVKSCVAGEGFYSDTLNACPQNFAHSDAKVALFEITTRHTYQARNRLQAVLTEHQFNLETPRDEVLKKLHDQVTVNVNLLYREYDDELTQNSSEEKQSCGKEVCYGDIIQLKHIVSGKMITFTQQVALFDSLCEAVMLQEGGPGSWIITTPRFKTRSDRSFFFYGEEVVMRSYSLAKLCLHMGAYEYPHTFLGPVYEICSHESLSPVTLSLFISASARSTFTCSLDLVHLQFLENSYYISCQYQQTDEARHVELDQVGEYSNPNSSTLVLSEVDANTQRPRMNSVWRIVSAQPSADGAVPIYFKSSRDTTSSCVYFQDVVTLKYLAARPCQADALGWKVDLSAEPTKDCLWHLLVATPQISEVVCLAENMPCMIRHVTSELYVGGVVDDQASSLGLFDSFEQQNVVMVSSASRSNAGLDSLFCYFSALKKYLQNTFRLFLSPQQLSPTAIRQCNRYLTMCQQVIMFGFPGSNVSIHDRRSLLNHSGLLHLIVGVCIASLNQNTTKLEGELDFQTSRLMLDRESLEYERLFRFLDAATRAASSIEALRSFVNDSFITLKVSCQQHAENGVLVSCVLPYLLDRVIENEHAFNLFCEILNENAELVRSINPSLLIKLIDLFAFSATFEAQRLFVQILIRLMRVKLQNVECNQEIIFRELFGHPERRKCLISFTFETGIPRVRRLGSQMLQDLSAIQSAENQSEFVAILGILELYHCICINAPTAHVSAVKVLVPVSCLFSLLAEEDGHPLIRMQAVYLLSSLVMFALPRSISFNRGCYCTDNLAADSIVGSLFHVQVPSQLKTQYLKDIQSVVARRKVGSNIDELNFSLQVFELLQISLHRGFFDEERTIIELSDSILSMLEHSVQRIDDLKELSEKKFLLTCSTILSVLKVINTLVDICTNVMVPRFLGFFNPQHNSSAPPSEPTSFGPPDKQTLIQVPSDYVESLDHVGVLRSFDINSGKLSKVLSFFMRVDHEDVKLQAAFLCLRLNCLSSEIWWQLKNSYVIYGKSASDSYLVIQEHLKTLTALIPRVQLLISSPLTFTDLDTDEKKKLTFTLSSMKALCVQSEGMDFADIASNREMICRTGVLQIIVDLLILAVRVDRGDVDPAYTGCILSDSPAGNEYIRDGIVKPCIDLISADCIRNTCAQAIVAPHTKQLLHLASRQLGLSELIMNIYDKNDAMIVSIDESIVFIICNIVCGNAPGVTDRFASFNIVYLDFLESICFVDGLPFLRNQNYIAKHLFSYSQRFLTMFQSEEEKILRVELMSVGSSAEPPAEIRYHTGMLRLLYTLCLGENENSVSKLRKLMSCKVLASDATNAKLSFLMRKCSLKLFTAVYCCAGYERTAEVEEAISSLLVSFKIVLQSIPLSSSASYQLFDSVSDHYQPEDRSMIVECWFPLLFNLLLNSAPVTLRVFMPVLDKIVHQLSLVLKNDSLEMSVKSSILHIFEVARKSGCTTTGLHLSHLALTQSEEIISPRTVFKSDLGELKRGLMYARAVYHGSESGTWLQNVYSSFCEVDTVRGESQKLSEPVHNTRFNHFCSNLLMSINPLCKFQGSVARKDVLQFCKVIMEDVESHIPNMIEFVKRMYRSGLPSNHRVALMAMHALQVVLKERRCCFDHAVKFVIDMSVLLWNDLSDYRADMFFERLTSISIDMLNPEYDIKSTQAAFLNEFNALNGCPLFFQSICDRLRRSSVDPNLLASVWRSISELARIGAKHGSVSPSMEDFLKDWFRPRSLEDELDLLLSNVNHRFIVAKQVTVCNPLNLLRMLQLFCELHNEDMQNILLFQPASPKSYNVLVAVVDFIGSCAYCMCPLTMPTCCQGLKTLIDMVQNPCRRNQIAISNTQLCNSLSRILGMKYEPQSCIKDDNREFSFIELKKQAVTMILAILEDAQVPDLASVVISSIAPQLYIDVCNFCIEVFIRDEDEEYKKGTSELTAMSGSKTIFEIFGDYLERQARDYVKKKNLQISDPSKNSPLGELARQTVQSCIIVNRSLMMYSIKFSVVHWNADVLDQGVQPAAIYHHLSKYVASVEIVRDCNIQREFFLVPDNCLYIQPSAVSELLYEVDRSNTNSQNSDFIRRAVDMENHMMESQFVHTKPILFLLQVFMPYLSTLFFWNVMLINLLVFVFAEHTDLQLYSMDGIQLRSGAREIIIILIALNVPVSLFRLFWEFHRVVLVKFAQSKKSAPLSSSLAKTLHVLKETLPKSGLCLWKTVCFLVCCISLAGGAAPLLMCILMLEVSNVSREVRTAIQSITFRGKSLLMTALLGIIIFYLFGAIGFVEFPDLFRFGRPDIVAGNALSPNNYAAECTTLWKCSVVVLDLGLRAKDLGAGMQELPWVDNNPDPRLFGRMIYTFMFFVIISLIVLNM
jgi:hypothetical protein